MHMPAKKNIHPMPHSQSSLRYATLADVQAYLVGGDLLFREGLKGLFSGSPVRVCGEAASVAEAVSEGSSVTPDVVILLDAPRACAAELRRVWPEVRCVVLARQASADALRSAIRLGVDGYLLTDMSPAALVQSISLIRTGENVFPARLTAEMLESPRSQEMVSCHAANLTPREIDILHGLLNGYSNKVIANKLGTTDATVKAQLRHLLRKIGAENRTQAALWARAQGLAADDRADG